MADKIWFKLTCPVCLELFWLYVDLRKSDDLRSLCSSFMLHSWLVMFCHFQLQYCFQLHKHKQGSYHLMLKVKLSN